MAPGRRPRHEIATILRHYSNQLNTIVNNTWKARTLYAIARCRTAQLGGHIDQCNHQPFGRLHMSYNSCRNRHCPKCQGHLREQWIEAREKDLLNTSYFHLVFTLPDHLNALALSDTAMVYNLLFKTAWSVVRDFAANPKFLGGQTGMVSVLHSWGQNMSLHPHLHCIVPAGALTTAGKWIDSKAKGKYLFPVKMISKVFRARLVQGLRKEKKLSAKMAKKLFDKPWVVYAKKPFFGPKQVIEYLGRYSHKIAISNHRIVDINQGKVTFTMKDYRKGGKKTLCTLDQREFIRRFSMHILPKGFTRIRHYGILSSTSKSRFKKIIDQQLGSVMLSMPLRISVHRKCPKCRIGLLQMVFVFDQRGPPKHWLEKLT